MKKAQYLFFVIFLFTSYSFAQDWADPNGITNNQLLNLIHSRYGSSFKYVQYTIFDTLINYSNRDNENIQDPYGTLRDCVLFSTYADNGENVPNTFITGIVKNDQIIWDNAPGTNADLGGRLLYAKDINNDGEVDLLFSETDKESLLSGKPPFLCYLYILSWNGTRGKFISAFNNSGKSTIIGDGSFELFYNSGDDNQEIKTILPEIDMDWGSYKTSNYPYITYGWNGTEYGFWSSIRQIAGNEFLQANKINVEVNCSVKKSNLYQYDYTVKNDNSSKQNISDIYIGGLEDTTGSQAPIHWQSGSSSYIGGRAFVKYSSGTYFLIHPGQTLSGFKTISSILPTIVKYYIQGYTPPVFGSPVEEKQNIYNNSVDGYTLGTSDTTIPFIALNFLDTLINYTNQSHSLGWIKDSIVANNYSTYFNTAKTSLEQNNIASTRAILQQVLQDVDVDSTNMLTSEAYALIRFNTEYLLENSPSAPQSGCIVKLVNSIGLPLTNGALQYRDTTWKDAINNNNGTFTINTTRKRLSLRMTYEYGTQTKTNIPVGTDTILFQTVNTRIQLQNSQGNSIDTGIVQYYAGEWRDIGITSNGVVTKELLPVRYTFRITYNSVSINKVQNIDTNSVVVFQTIPVKVQLQTSTGIALDTGFVQYYSGEWKDFGITSNGEVIKELLPRKYTFRMNYNNANDQKAQSIDSNSVVVFRTVNASVELRDSQNALLDTGLVQYYSAGWKDFGITSNGVVRKELLPARYNFRMTYNSASKTKVQNLDTNSVVIFQTSNISVELRNSQNELIDTGIVQYYSGGWKEFGVTQNGIANKELLPVRYRFRMNYGYSNNQKVQNTDTNAVVTFQTVNAAAQLKNSRGILIDTGIVEYYAGGWKDFGTTENGTASKELLANNYNFRMTYASISNTKRQDLDSSTTVSFSTVLCSVRVTNSEGQLLDNAIVTYYRNGWKTFGTTLNGVTAKELLPANIIFRVQYGNTRQQKAQDINLNPNVEFSIP